MTSEDSTLEPSNMPRLALITAIVAALAFAAVMFAPKELAIAVALVGCVALAAVVFRRPEVAIIALVGAAALDITGRLATIGGAKITIYQGLLVVVLGFVFWRVRTGRSKLVSTPVDLPLAMFCALAVASVFVAVQPALALVQVASLFSCALLVYVVVVLVDTPEKAELVVLGVLGLACLWSVAAYFEKRGLFHIGQVIITYGYGIRTKVTFKDPNILGDFLTVSAALAMPLAVVAKSKLKRVAVLAGVALCFVAVLWTGSRGAFGGFLIAAMVVVLALRIPLWQKLLLLGVAVAGVVGGLAFFVNPMWVQDKVLGLWQDQSWMDRVRIVNSGIAIARDNIFGVGAGNFPVVYPFYRDPVVRFDLVESHTMLATLVVEYGFAGLFVFLWLLWRFLSRMIVVAWHEKPGRLQALATGVLAAGMGVFAQSFTYSLETSKYLWLTIGLGMAVYTMAKAPSDKEIP